MSLDRVEYLFNTSLSVFLCKRSEQDWLGCRVLMLNDSVICFYDYLIVCLDCLLGLVIKYWLFILESLSGEGGIYCEIFWVYCLEKVIFLILRVD